MATDDSSPAPLPRRRRFQFSLKTLLVLTALWAVVLGVWRFNQNMNELDETVRYHHLEYDEGTLHIFCYRDTFLSERTIAATITAVAHLGPVNGIEITSVNDEWYTEEERDPLPLARLTRGAWDYIDRLKLRSFSTDNLSNTDIPKLQKLSSLRQLAVPASVGSRQIRAIQIALPNCKITVH